MSKSAVPLLPHTFDCLCKHQLHNTNERAQLLRLLVKFHIIPTKSALNAGTLVSWTQSLSSEHLIWEISYFQFIHPWRMTLLRLPNCGRNRNGTQQPQYLHWHLSL